MATKQILRTKRNERGEWLYSYNGSEVTSREYTADIEKQILTLLKITPASRFDDMNGIDGTGERGERYQLKIMHNGKSSYTLPRELCVYRYIDGEGDTKDFRRALWEYSKKFDKLLIYFGESTIGAPLNTTNICIISGQMSIYKCLYLRTYMGYAQNHNGECQFNKTQCSDLTARYLTRKKAEKWAADILKHSEFMGNDEKRLQYILNNFFSFKYQKDFKIE